VNNENPTYGDVLMGRTQMVPASFPENWGGRPTGQSRRAIRMQGEWDKQRAQQIEEMKAFQQMELQNKQFEMQQRDQQLQEDDFYYNRGIKEAEQKYTTQQRAEARSIVESLNQLDPRSPDFSKNLADIFTQNSLGAADPNVQKIVGIFQDANTAYMSSLEKVQSGQKDAEKAFASDMQKLLESGVTEEELPQYYNTDAPVGVPQFDARKVATRLGTTKSQEKEEDKATRKEAPQKKISLDITEAYGRLNELLMSGADTDKARSDVAGLRERYKEEFGEYPQEILPRPQSQQQYDRLPSGTFWIDPKGVTKQKQ
jgi:hypothetical protein